MPVPRPYENKDSFISRCIPILINEGKDKGQAAAICQSLWDEKKMTAYERAIKEYKNNDK